MNEQEKIEAEIKKIREMGLQPYLKQKVTVRMWVVGAAFVVGLLLGALVL